MYQYNGEIFGPGPAVVNPSCCSHREVLCSECRAALSQNTFLKELNMNSNRRRRYDYEEDHDVEAMMAYQNPIAIIANERREEMARGQIDDEPASNRSTRLMSDDEKDVRDMTPPRMVFKKDW